jgi:hypothetical protein
MNTQEYLHNEKASDDANFNFNLLSSNVTSEQQSHASDDMKILDRNIVEAAGDENELNNNLGNQIDNGNGNDNGNLDESEGMEATTDSDNIDRWPEYCDPNYRMLGMITVRVTLDLEERRFQVNIIKAVKCSKIYLGEPSFLPSFLSFLPSFICFLPVFLPSFLCHFFLFLFLFYAQVHSRFLFYFHPRFYSYFHPRFYSYFHPRFYSYFLSHFYTRFPYSSRNTLNAHVCSCTKYYSPLSLKFFYIPLFSVFSALPLFFHTTDYSLLNSTKSYYSVLNRIPAHCFFALDYAFYSNIIIFISPISGGFRNKINGSLYHHASTQTPTVKKELKDFSNLRTRETQTFETRTLSVQSYREAGLEFGFLMLLLVVV